VKLELYFLCIYKRGYFMRKLCSKVLVFTLVVGSLLPAMQSKAAEGRVQNDKASVQTVANSHKYLASKKSQSGLKLNNLFIEDLSLDYGAISKKCNDKLTPEHVGHGEYCTEIPYTNNCSYYFDTYDPDLNYELKDTSPCIRVEGPLNEILSGFKAGSTKRMSVKSFIKLLKKNNYNVKYKYRKGELTSYYVSDEFEEVTFKIKKSGKVTYCLHVGVSSKDNSVSPDSITWLFVKK
jgi:hypothetical protein